MTKILIDRSVVEPVAWRYQDAGGNYRYRGYVPNFDVEYKWLKPVPLYTAPVAQKPPLTDEQIEALGHRIATKYTHRSDPASHSYGFVRHTLIDFARAIEKHGIGGGNESR